MAEIMYEGVVRGGVIRLSADVALPENSVVYVTIPDPSPEQKEFEVTLPERAYRIMSPRLTDSAQASRFVMEVREIDRADI